MAKKDIPRGAVFNRLTVVKELDGTTQRKFLCKCSCGKKKIVQLGHLKSGHTKSCGCLAVELSKTRNRKHNESNTPLYRIWADMRNRCSNPNNKDYKHYGGRGIYVCDAWDESFSAFKRDMLEGYEKGLQIDRENNNGPYSPKNCRWVTKKQNGRNRRNNRLLTHNGVTLCVTEWAEKIGVTVGALRSRLRRGWPIEKALNNYKQG